MFVLRCFVAVEVNSFMEPCAIISAICASHALSWVGVGDAPPKVPVAVWWAFGNGGGHGAARLDSEDGRDVHDQHNIQNGAASNVAELTDYLTQPNPTQP